jgi:hypothetical protein
MDLLVLVPAFLRAIATALTSPAFNTVRYTAMLADITSLGALLVELGADGHAKLKELADHITGLVQSGEAPSPDDWARLGQLHIEARKLIEAYLQEQLAAPLAGSGLAPPIAELSGPQSIPAAPIGAGG